MKKNKNKFFSGHKFYKQMKKDKNKEIFILGYFFLFVVVFIAINSLVCYFSDSLEKIQTGVGILTLIFIVILLFFFKKKLIRIILRFFKRKNKSFSDEDELDIFITDERNFHTDFPKETEKEFNQKVQLESIQWVVRHLKIDFNKEKEIKKWLELVSENFLFDQEDEGNEKNTEINQNFLLKISQNNIFEKSELNSLNNLVRLIQNESNCDVKNVKKFKIKNSKTDFIDNLYKFCFEKKMNAYVFQTVNENEYKNSDKKNRGIVIGEENKYKELSIGIPNIIANLWAIEQPSMIILDFEAKIYKKIGYYSKFLGYNLNLVDMYDLLSDDSNSKKWNPLEKLYWLSLLLAILKDFQKQFLDYELFVNTKYDEMDNNIQTNSETYDFSVDELVPNLSILEYLELKEKYKQRNINKQNFIYDDSLVSENIDYLENKNFYFPILKSKENLDNEKLFCGIHNEEIGIKCCKENVWFINDKYLLINEIILSNQKNLNSYIEKINSEKNKLIECIYQNLFFSKGSEQELKNLFALIMYEICLFLESSPNKFNINKFNFDLFEKFIQKFDQINNFYEKIELAIKKSDELIFLEKNKELSENSEIKKNNTYANKIYSNLNYKILKFQKRYTYKTKTYNENVINNLKLLINKYFNKREYISNETFYFKKEFNSDTKPKIIFIVLPNNNSESYELASLFMKLFFEQINNLTSRKWFLISNNYLYFLNDLVNQYKDHLITEKVKTLFFIESISKLQEKNFFDDSKLKICLDLNRKDSEYVSELLGKKNIIDNHYSITGNKLTGILKQKKVDYLNKNEIMNIYTESSKKIIVINNKRNAVLYCPFFDLSSENYKKQVQIKDNIENKKNNLNLNEYLEVLDNQWKVIENYKKEYEKTFQNIPIYNKYKWPVNNQPHKPLLLELSYEDNKQLLRNKNDDSKKQLASIILFYIKKIFDNKFSISDVFNKLEDKNEKKYFAKIYETTKNIINFELKKSWNNLKSNSISNLTNALIKNEFKLKLNNNLTNDIFILVDEKIVSIFECLTQPNLQLDSNLFGSMFNKSDFVNFIKKRIESAKSFNAKNNLKLRVREYENKLNSLIYNNIDNIEKNLKKINLFVKS